MKENVQRHSRRQLLGYAPVLAAGALGAPGSPVLAASAQALQVQQLSESVLLVQGPGANALVVSGDEGLVLADGGHAAWSGMLQDIISEVFPGRQVAALVNTHWHPEQTGSNVLLGAGGTEIIAHTNTRQWLGSEIHQRWSGQVFAPLPAQALPTRLLDDSASLSLAGMDIHASFLWKAHTDGDLALFFEEANILVCGGLVSNGHWPDIDWWTGGYSGGMLDALVALLTLPDDDTLIIPAVGDIMTRAELLAQNAMYVSVLGRVHELFLASYSLDEILAEDPAAPYRDSMGDPGLFITLAFQSLLGHLRDPQNFRILNLP